MHPDVPQQFKPLVFEHGSPVCFPAPTRHIALSVGSKFASSIGYGGKPSIQPRKPQQEEKPKTQARKHEQRASACSEAQHGEYTTVMLRNLPNDYSRNMLVELLDSQGFNQRFDFIYVPIDFEKSSGLGYAFVNFVRHEDAQNAMQTLKDFDDWKVPSRKRLQLSWSLPLQGLTANIERYRNNSVMHSDVPEQFKPLVLKDGFPICFPPPSRNIHPPQRRKQLDLRK